jgi:hypothetical protein
MKTIKKAQKGGRVGKTNVVKSAGPKSGSGNPLTGRSAPSSKSAFSTAAQKRMKSQAEGSMAPINMKTRVLPEMSGKASLKTSDSKKSIMKKKDGGKVVAKKAKYGITASSKKKMMYGGEMDMAKKGASVKKKSMDKCKMGC